MCYLLQLTEYQYAIIIIAQRGDLYVIMSLIGYVAYSRLNTLILLLTYINYVGKQ